MSVDDLNRRLYDRNNRLNGIRRSRLSVAPGEGPTSWENVPAEIVATTRRFNLPLKIFIISVAVFILTLAAALIVLFGNVSVVSDSDIALVLQGPTSIKAGDEVPITVSITNKNRVPLESAELAVIYPSGSKDSGGGALSRERKPLGLILPGSTKNVVLKSVIYGPESFEQEIKITLEYHLSGSNALFQKDSVFKTRIGSPSINLSTSLPSEITSNQPLEIEVTLNSNDRKTLKNVLLNVDYPPGFSFQSSQPLPFASNNAWLLGDLLAGGNKGVTIKGVLEGQDQEVKSFNFTAGESTGNDTQSIDARYATLFRTVTINRPSITTRLAINGSETNEYISQAGEKIKVDLDWANNLPTVIQDAEFKIYLSGNVFDRLSVNAGRGFYQSADNTIIWNKSNNDDLALIEPGKSGRVSFTFSILPAGRLPEGGAQILSLKLAIKGLRVDSEISEREISAEFEKTIKVGSSLQLAGRSVYYVGPFMNHGPIPPKAGQETSYSVIWSVVNQSNLVRNGVARAKLPASVKWVGIVSPSTEKVSYDEAKNEVVWELGDVPAGTGRTSPAREAAFQLALTPSLSQVGSVANVLEEAIFTGYDTFAGVEVRRVNPALTTKLSTDPKWLSNTDKVTE